MMSRVSMGAANRVRAIRVATPPKPLSGPRRCSKRSMAAASGELAFRTGLVGRAAEVGKLRFALDSALAGRGRVVFLAGEAGVRKPPPPGGLAHAAGAEGFPP